MDGLIKGLMDVAIAQFDNHHNDDDDHDAEQRDERSRSTWAQVVNNEGTEEEDGGRDTRHGQGRHQSDHRFNEDGGNQNEDWEVVGSRPSRDPQKAAYEGYGGDESNSQHENENSWNIKEEESNDGWETVGKKPPRHHKIQTDNWNGYKRPPSEQEYSEDDSHHDSIEPSEEELADLSLACNKLWDIDFNRLIPEKDYQIDCGEGKKVYQQQDMAEGCLFTWLSEDTLRRPTISRFCSLLDNYNPHSGAKEVVTSEESQEQVAFIEEISRTAPIKYLHKYLSTKGVVSSDPQEFKHMMISLWFDLYGRGGTSSSSSAFEHVFVGEIKQSQEQEVSGFHNWLQFYLEEAKGRVDYQGYIFPRCRGETPDAETQLLTIQFEWNGILKSVSSTLVGVSPEFEIALYTLCFFMGSEDNHVELGPYPVNIKCYRLRDKIGSVFPIAEN